MCLKQSVFYSKRVLPSILSLTVLSNCVSGGSNFNIAFLPDCTKFCTVFLKLQNRKINDDSKNVLKTIIFLLEEGFTRDFIIDCLYKLCFWQFKL